MTPLIIDATLPIVGAAPTALPEAQRWRAQGGSRMETPPPRLAFTPKPRVFYRVLGYQFFTDELTWHSSRNLHTHLACPVIGTWVRGGFRGAGGGRKGRTYPPTPPTLAAERFDVLETPRSLRCDRCSGPLLDLPDQQTRERDLGYQWRFDYAWGEDQNFKKALDRWRTFVGGLDGRAFLVWNGSEFRSPEAAACG